MTDKFTRPSAIFLDWDGTLADSFSFLLAAHNHVRGIFSLAPFTAEKFMEYFGQPREALYKNLYGENAAGAKAHFEAFVRENHLKHLKPLPGADDLVKAIHAAGLISGVVSNKKGDFVRSEIESFGWTTFFHAIVGAGDAPQDKPAADPLLLAIRQAGAGEDPSQCWYIGDSETDALCARNAGSKLVMLDHGDNIGPWIKDYRPVLTARKCMELVEIIEKF